VSANDTKVPHLLAEKLRFGLELRPKIVAHVQNGGVQFTQGEDARVYWLAGPLTQSTRQLITPVAPMLLLRSNPLENLCRIIDKNSLGSRLPFPSVSNNLKMVETFGP
jgi:hypothetical protein